MRQRGFVLILVLGLLGMLAYLALDFASGASMQRRLSQNWMLRVKARMASRSGVEWAVGDICANLGVSKSRYIAGGTLGNTLGGGDSFTIWADDSNGSIDLNDGLEAGRQDMGSRFNPRAVTLSPMEIVFSGADGFLVAGDPHFNMDQVLDPATLFPGDELVIVSGTPGHDGSRWTIQSSETIPGPSGTRITLTENPRFDVSTAPVTWMIERQDSSGQINLRLRRLLNAYGDVHLYLSKLGDPADPASSFVPHVPGAPMEFSSTDAQQKRLPLRPLSKDGSTFLDDINLIAAEARGLGDRLIASRPPLGWQSASQVKDIVNQWAQDMGLPAPYCGTNQTFYDKVSGDFTINAPMDSAFSRMKRELGPYGNDALGEDFDPSSALFSPRYMDTDPPVLADLWAPHPVAPLNMNSASREVLAAMFYAPANVSYLCEGADVDEPSDSTVSYRLMSRPNLGVSGPVFRAARQTENGNATPANVQNLRFMSLTDALHLSWSYRQRAATAGFVEDFEGFRSFLAWHSSNYPVEYERAEPRGTPYDPAPAAGYFTQDYVEKALPHFFSCVIRLPGFMGAPQPLLSPYLKVDQDPADPGVSPIRKVEDFVFRHDMPKATFLPMGRFVIRSTGCILNAAGAEKARHAVTALTHVFQTDFYRSQSQFRMITDSSSSAEMLIGPEAESVVAHDHLGFVGLKDRDDPMIQTPAGVFKPQIMMNFKGVTMDPAMKFKPTRPNADPAFTIANTRINNPVPVATDPALVFKDTYLEDPTNASLFSRGSSGSDLNPFGGLQLSALGHGERARRNPGKGIQGERHSDSIYWNVVDVKDSSVVPPSAPVYLVNKNAHTAAYKCPIGTHFSNMLCTLWFRIPTSYSSKVAGVSDFHSLVSLVLHEEDLGTQKSPIPFAPIRPIPITTPWANLPGVSVDTVRPIYINLGWSPADRSIVLRHDVPPMPYNHHIVQTGSDNWYPEPPKLVLWYPFKGSNASSYFFPAGTYSAYYGANSTPPQRVLCPMMFDNNTSILGVNVPKNNVPALGANLKYLQGIWQTSMFWRVKLRDVPENGPGSWHRVTFGTNITNTSAGYLHPYTMSSDFWLKVRDEAAVESYEFTREEWVNMTAAWPTFTYMYNVNPGLVLSLGEVQSRRSAVYPEAGSIYGDYFPSWRLNSSIDNFQLHLNGKPSTFNAWTGTSYPSEQAGADRLLRYNIRATGDPLGASEPDWILKPTKSGAQYGDRLLGCSARIFNPLDENGNHPTAVLSATAFTSPSTHVPLVFRTNPLGTGIFLPNTFVEPGTRYRLQYKARRPDGTPLVQTLPTWNYYAGLGFTSSFTPPYTPRGLFITKTATAGDAWTEIPWIQEVSMRYVPRGFPKFVSWSEE